MKTTKSAAVIIAAAAISVLAVSCSKKEKLPEDSVPESSKLVTGTIEVTPQANDFSNLSNAADSDTSTDLDNIFGSLSSGLNDFATTTADSLNTAIDTLKDSDTLNAITDTLSSAASTLSNPETYTNAIESAKDSLSSITGNITESVKNSDVVTSIGDTFSNAAENLTNLLPTTNADKETKGVDQETKDAMDSLDSLVNDLGSLFGKKN